MAEDVANLTFEILKRLQADVGGLREEFAAFRTETRGELTSVHDEITSVRDELNSVRGELRAEMASGFAQIGARVGHLEAETIRAHSYLKRELEGHRALVIDRLRDHERRLTALEHAPRGAED